MKLAIVKLSALGDIVHAMVALQFIKQQLPNSEIDWLVEAHFADLLAHNPDINRVLPIHLKALKKKPTQFVEFFLLKQRQFVEFFSHTETVCRVFFSYRDSLSSFFAQTESVCRVFCSYRDSL